ncbi:hypothetical protein CR513_18261, partial [Mucuna pruriens]
MPSKRHNFIVSITRVKELWYIVARIVRLYSVVYINKNSIPFSMEMMFMDDNEDRIHDSIRKRFIYNIASNVRNFKITKHQYKLNLQNATKVVVQEDNCVSSYPYNFICVTDIFLKDHDRYYLIDKFTNQLCWSIDVMGTKIIVGTKREYERGGVKTKMN